MEYLPVAGAAPPQVDNRVETVTIIEDSCVPCHLMEAENGEGDVNVHHLYIKASEAIAAGLAGQFNGTTPTTLWRKRSNPDQYWRLVGKYSTKQIWGSIQGAGDYLRVSDQVVSYGGRGGRSPGAFQLHGRQQIKQFLSYMEQYVGEGKRVKIHLLRSGNERFGLLSKTDKSVRAWLGDSGHLRISSAEWKLPCPDLGMGWDLDRKTLDLDPILIPDLERYADRQMRGAAIVETNGQIAGFFIVDDLIFWGSLVSAIQTIGGLFNPTLDLILPAEIEATAVLHDGAVTIDFQKGPSIYFAELVRGTLVLQRVTISESNVHADLAGPWYVPRLLKHRDIAVVE